jgi:hypothetical protein
MKNKGTYYNSPDSNIYDRLTLFAKRYERSLTQLLNDIISFYKGTHSALTPYGIKYENEILYWKNSKIMLRHGMDLKYIISNLRITTPDKEGRKYGPIKFTVAGISDYDLLNAMPLSDEGAESEEELKEGE